MLSDPLHPSRALLRLADLNIIGSLTTRGERGERLAELIILLKGLMKLRSERLLGGVKLYLLPRSLKLNRLLNERPQLHLTRPHLLKACEREVANRL